MLQFIKRHFLFIVFTLGIIIFRGPEIWKNLQAEYQQKSVSVPIFKNLKGENINPKYPLLIVFWASWCGPCDIELSRIQNLIERNLIESSQVVAVSIDLHRKDLEMAISKRNYTFPVSWSHEMNLSDQFEVNVTPTIILLNKDQKIIWSTSGLSPSLELRLLKDLK